MKDFQAGTRAVIFDLDGVIADSEPLHQLGFRQLFEELGLDPGPTDDWHRFVGTSDRSVLIRLLDGREVGRSLDELLDRKAALFLDLLKEREPLFPEIPDLVPALAARYPLAVASGSLRTAIAGVLELRGLRRHFQFTVSVQDVAHGKPAPDLFLRAAELLGVAPQACVVLEDSVAGVTAARAAGMRVIGITNTTSRELLEAARADAVVTHYHHVRSLLLA
ncbi:MAG: HAD family phosphatase [Verrucomicrobiales bacterium]|nr:HAD family phosphatase [Verrucomicrobiales bacterium]